MEDNHYNFHHYGTGAGIIGKHLEGHMIVRNFQDGQWDPEQIEAIDAKTIEDTYVDQDGRLLRVLGALQEARQATRRWRCCPSTAARNTRPSARWAPT